jgi:integrase
MPIGRISKRSVEALSPDPTRDVYLRDDLVKGFLVKVTRTGTRGYHFEYKNHARTTRRLHLGQHGECTAVEARRKAREFADMRRAGHDPAQPRTDQRKAPTLGIVLDRWLEQVAIIRKPKTLRDYRGWVDREIRPRLGSHKVTDVSLEDIEKIRKALQNKRVTFNRVYACLNAAFNFAIKRRWAQTNPCVGLTKFDEDRVVHFFSKQDLQRLKVVLNDHEREGNCLGGIDAVRLLALTGCRLNEILQLHWNQVAFNKESLELPDSKTGAKRVTVGKSALDVLQAIQLRQVVAGHFDAKGFVCRGATGNAVGNLPKWWRRWREGADLGEATLHMFRHTYATRAANHGVPLHTVKGLMGHRSSVTTERYAHPNEGAERTAADTVAQLLEDDLLSSD